MLANTELTPAGWLFMLASCIAVTWLTFWCFKKVLSQPDEPDLPPGLGP